MVYAFMPVLSLVNLTKLFNIFQYFKIILIVINHVSMPSEFMLSCLPYSV